METIRFRLFSDGKTGAALFGVLHGLQYTGTRADRGALPNDNVLTKRKYDLVEHRKTQRR